MNLPRGQNHHGIHEVFYNKGLIPVIYCPLSFSPSHNSSPLNFYENSFEVVPETKVDFIIFSSITFRVLNFVMTNSLRILAAK
jgi:hypothetical protein